ncbi:hypothetical protein Glove_174g176 [Diversispora epigaea]|uniref:Ion transport domain-containing protein n=1 Tax=Diversispora epigaea TaxID=1348612 RepID=A0A397IP09_9GLOM|nr:hypothetical protein Glove_174g176 [Diversispora epigaea]
MSTTVDSTTILMSGDNGNDSNPNNSPHTQYTLSRSEVVRGIANRIIYSRFYSWLYLGMALLSAVSIVLSLIEECQTIGFIILEIIINIVMIGEVTTRFLALRKIFWKSLYNIIDIILVMLCVITLILILKGGCLHKGEEIFDLTLLIVRNLVQFGRLIVMLRKKEVNRKARNATVDFNNVRESNDSFSDPGEHSIIYDEYDEDFL